jgi:hypothetical protein
MGTSKPKARPNTPAPREVRNILDGSIAEHEEPAGVSPEDAQREAERAFKSSGKYTFNGIELEPLSIGRVATLQEIGLKYWSMTARDMKRIPIAQPGKPTTFYFTYDGMLKDVILLLYICTLPMTRVLDIVTDDEKAQFRADAFEWAEAQGISMLNKKHGEAYVLFNLMIADLHATQAMIDPNQKQPGKSSDRSGN